MSFDAGSISGKIGLNIDGYTQSMLKATSIAQIFPSTITNFMANPLLGFSGIAKSALQVGVAGMQALANSFAQTTKFADDMGDLAEQVGVAVENLTALGQVASMSGGSIEGVADAYRFLGKNIAEAAENADGKAGEAFRKLNVQLTDSAGKSRSLEDIMLDLADGFQNVAPGAERTALAMELLGRSGTQMIPTLAQGSAALKEQMERMREYGAAVTQHSRESSDRWNDAVGEMGLAWQGLQQQINEPLRDALLPYLESALAWTRDNMPTISKTIADAMTGVKKFIDDYGASIYGFSEGTIIALKKVSEFVVSTLDMMKTYFAAAIALMNDPMGFIKDPGGSIKGTKLAVDMGFRAAGLDFRNIGAQEQSRAARSTAQDIYDAARQSNDAKNAQLGGAVQQGIFTGQPSVNVNVPGVNQDELAKSIAGHVTPKIEQRVREAEAAAEAVGRRKRVKDGFR